MGTKAIGQPRRIDPSLVEIGDDISVQLKSDRGIVTTLRGVVGKRLDHGKVRYLMTNEGATLLAWEPNTTKRVIVTLFGREEYPQESMFELPQEIQERIAG